MPVFLLWPLVGGGLGLIGGLWAADTMSSAIKWAAVAGVGYLIYTQVKK